MKKLLSKLLLGEIVRKVETDAPIDVVTARLEKAVAEHGFGIQAVHDLKQTYLKNHLQLDPDFEYRIIQICQASKSHRALKDLSYDMGVMMPKSIIVARENGKTTLRYLRFKPWMVSLMFPETEVAPLSKKVTETIESIIRNTLEGLPSSIPSS